MENKERMFSLNGPDPALIGTGLGPDICFQIRPIPETNSGPTLVASSLITFDKLIINVLKIRSRIEKIINIINLQFDAYPMIEP